MKLLRCVGNLAGIFLHLAAQLMFSIDHLANPGEDVGVIHAPQPRDATGAASLRGSGTPRHLFDRRGTSSIDAPIVMGRQQLGGA
jgi:hypothetical protein